MNIKPFAFLTVTSLVTVAFATVLTAPMKLVINGKSVSGKTATIDGQTYVPLSALKAAGATSSINGDTLSINIGPAGGANQVGALEGGINDWLFDGVWRFRVTGVTPNDDGRPGWKVQVELRNGSKADDVALSGTGFDSFRLIMADGNALTAYNEVDLTAKGLGQGGSAVLSMLFYDDDGGGRKPDRLVMHIAPDKDTTNYMKRIGIGYTTADPSFRVNLKPPTL